MKKLRLLLVGILLLPLLVIEVHAASIPYAWIVGGESLQAKDQNDAQTATQKKEGDTITLTLNNYNGGALELTCYGTCTKANIIIELVGENVITADDMGIIGASQIQFSGDGKLTINAPTPIQGSSNSSPLVIQPHKAQEPPSTIPEEVTTTEKETTKEGEKEEEKAVAPSLRDENSTFSFVLGVGTGLGVVVILGGIWKLTAAPKKEKLQAPKEEPENEEPPKEETPVEEETKEE